MAHKLNQHQLFVLFDGKGVYVGFHLPVMQIWTHMHV